MKISILRSPTEDDWRLVYQCALVTVGKDTDKEPSLRWKQKMLEARHSPIRELRFVFLLEDIPYWVSVHLCRHIHAQPYVRSQRNDRQAEYDRNSAPQDAPVNMIWSMNAEELMVIANKRLCKKAAQETRYIVQHICRLVIDTCEEFDGLLVPMCEYHDGKCHEVVPCWRDGV